LNIGIESLDDFFDSFHKKSAASTWTTVLTGNLAAWFEDARKDVQRE
jgi:hypothetical protein